MDGSYQFTMRTSHLWDVRNEHCMKWWRNGYVVCGTFRCATELIKCEKCNSTRRSWHCTRVRGSKNEHSIWRDKRWHQQTTETSAAETRPVGKEHRIIALDVGQTGQHVREQSISSRERARVLPNMVRRPSLSTVGPITLFPASSAKDFSSFSRVSLFRGMCHTTDRALQNISHHQILRNSFHVISTPRWREEAWSLKPEAWKERIRDFPAKVDFREQHQVSTNF